MSDTNGIMPVLFMGHGNPMNAIESNEFSEEWIRQGKSLPRPEAVLCISAHWETSGTAVTAMEQPGTIHDFGGFPEELYEFLYPAPGSPRLAERIIETAGGYHVQKDLSRGLDHGCWSVLSRMFPEADIPVVQLSLDRTKTGRHHYDLGKALFPLRKENVLIVGSGNIVHNLGLVRFPDDGDFNRPFAFDWALEASEQIIKLIEDEDHQALADYPSLGRSVRLAVPTPEHFLPLLYVLGLKSPSERFQIFNDKHLAGSLTMTCLRSVPSG